MAPAEKRQKVADGDAAPKPKAKPSATADTAATTPAKVKSEPTASSGTSSANTSPASSSISSSRTSSSSGSSSSKQTSSSGTSSRKSSSSSSAASAKPKASAAKPKAEPASPREAKVKDEAKSFSREASPIAGFDPTEVRTQLAGEHPNGYGWSGPAPTRTPDGVLHFADKPTFQPNLTPKEVLQAGSFGGGYFRPIYSAVTKKHYNRVWEELPPDWLEGLDIKRKIASTTYLKSVNRYKVDCGVKSSKQDAFGLDYWETAGWIMPQDPYGWFMWYCRFYQGRRSADDERQISRWCKAAGATGRWRQNLIAKVLRDGKGFDSADVSPVVRQTLQHWGYRLTESDFNKGAKKVRRNGAAYVPREELAHVIMTPKGKKRKAEDEE